MRREKIGDLLELGTFFRGFFETAFLMGGFSYLKY